MSTNDAVSGASQLPECPEGTIRFKKFLRGEYSVFTDCITGEMQFLGRIERLPMDQANGTTKWQGRCGKALFYGPTRIAVAEQMVQS